MNPANPNLARSLALREWPTADREAWEEACRPNLGLKRGGRAGHLKKVTQDDLARRYGYFLFDVDRSEGLRPDASVGAYITPDRVSAYLLALQGRVSSVTTAGNVRKLYRIASILRPDEDYTWLKELALDLELVATPHSKLSRVVSSRALLNAGLTMVAEADLSPNSCISTARIARDGVMIALLAVCPIRLKNFSSLRLGHSLIARGRHYAIALPGEDTKSGRPDERPVPPELTPALDRYLQRYRLVLLKIRHPDQAELELGLDQSFGCAPDDLWISRITGQALGYSGVERAICEATRQIFGHSVNPHLFRTCAASTAAMYAGDRPHLASALLQHMDQVVTEQHYNRASSLHASHSYGELIARLIRRTT